MKRVDIKVVTEEYKNAIVLLVAVAVLSIIYGGYKLYLMSEENKVLMSEISLLQNNLENTELDLSMTQDEAVRLIEALNNEQERLDSIKGTLAEVTDTVSDLEKLKSLDPELLQKYSKVYFLNEHYMPSDLKDIDKEYLYHENKSEQIDERVWLFLRKLLKDAEDDDIDLFVASGFRSFGTQAELKSGYVFTYGAGSANEFSADQGYSEHQLGTTVDFMTTGIDGTFSGFEDTDAYKWLSKNAYKQGFVLSYPEDNTYYKFEPWHWRFVGQELADDLYDDDLFFYDIAQRDIDKYLLEIFD